MSRERVDMVQVISSYTKEGLNAMIKDYILNGWNVVGSIQIESTVLTGILWYCTLVKRMSIEAAETYKGEA